MHLRQVLRGRRLLADWTLCVRRGPCRSECLPESVLCRLLWRRLQCLLWVRRARRTGVRGARLGMPYPGRRVRVDGRLCRRRVLHPRAAHQRRGPASRMALPEPLVRSVRLVPAWERSMTSAGTDAGPLERVAGSAATGSGLDRRQLLLPVQRQLLLPLTAATRTAPSTPATAAPTAS